jgi:hypothetical protein
MFELKKIEEHTATFKKKGEPGEITTVKWKALFKDEDSDPYLNLVVEYGSEPTHLRIGSIYKIELKE